MQAYRIIKPLGDGTYGSVLKAVHIQRGEIVAIKKMKKKFTSWDEAVSLREVTSLQQLSHPNIVALREVIRENGYLYFVFEYLDQNLYQMTKDQKKLLPETKIRNYMWQILSGLEYMHRYGIFHRDIKPENLLIKSANASHVNHNTPQHSAQHIPHNYGEIVKLCDFGLAREIRSRGPYTDYVSTRWYRAPEVLLRSTRYNSPIDIWACGCILAELYTFRPLFPGASEPDQLHKIMAILGTPTTTTWPDGIKLANAMHCKLPKFTGQNLHDLIPRASPQALDLIRLMLSYDPVKRPTAAQCMQHPYFHVGDGVIPTSASAMAQMINASDVVKGIPSISPENDENARIHTNVETSLTSLNEPMTVCYGHRSNNKNDPPILTYTFQSQTTPTRAILHSRYYPTSSATTTATTAPRSRVTVSRTPTEATTSNRYGDAPSTHTRTSSTSTSSQSSSSSSSHPRSGSRRTSFASTAALQLQQDGTVTHAPVTTKLGSSSSQRSFSRTMQR